MTHLRLDVPRLLDVIYDASDVSTPWQSVLETLAAHFRAEVGHLFQVDSSGKLVSSPSFHGASDDKIGEYHDKFQAEDMRFSIALASPGTVFSDVFVIDAASFERTAVYNEHLRPAGIRYSLFTVGRVGDGVQAGQGFFRPLGGGPFGREDVEGFTLLLPHIARALRLRNLTRSLRNQAQDLKSMVDALSPPALVLDEAGRILCESRSAEELLTAKIGLTRRTGRLSSEDSHTRSAIEEAVRHVARIADPPRLATSCGPSTKEVFVVEQSRADQVPLRLLFLPLRAHQAVREAGERRARILVVLIDPEAVRRLDPTIIAKVYGLTPTEGLLAVALAEGASLAEFAEQRGTSEHTVRTQLKRILEKTGTRRQAEIVRVILSCAPRNH